MTKRMKGRYRLLGTLLTVCLLLFALLSRQQSLPSSSATGGGDITASPFKIEVIDLIQVIVALYVFQCVIKKTFRLE